MLIHLGYSIVFETLRPTPVVALQKPVRFCLTFTNAMPQPVMRASQNCRAAALI